MVHVSCLPPTPTEFASVFSHLHPFLHFLGPFQNLNKRCFSFNKAAISSFRHQDSLCLLIPRVSPQTSIASSVRHSLKFLYTSSTPVVFSTTSAALVCTRSSKMPAVTSSLNFQTLHLFSNSILRLFNPSFRSKTQMIAHDLKYTPLAESP